MAPTEAEQTVATETAPSSKPEEPAAVSKIDISGDAGVLKQVLREGSGDCPPSGSKVRVHYVGRLLDGTKFDSSRDRDEEFEFDLGKGRVIKGWDLGVAKMKEGELAILTCRSDYAYGEAGSPPTIPPGATLEFEVELIDFSEPSKDDEDLEFHERIDLAKKRKDDGNDLYKKGLYAKAIKKYNKVISLFDFIVDDVSEEQRKEMNALKSSALLNVAQSRIKLGESKGAIDACTKALEVDGSNVKALFRRAQAYSLASEYDKAKADLTTAIRLDPNNAELRKELQTTKEKEAALLKKEKALYSSMFK